MKATRKRYAKKRALYIAHLAQIEKAKSRKGREGLLVSLKPHRTVLGPEMEAMHFLTPKMPPKGIEIGQDYLLELPLDLAEAAAGSTFEDPVESAQMGIWIWISVAEAPTGPGPSAPEPDPVPEPDPSPDPDPEPSPDPDPAPDPEPTDPSDPDEDIRGICEATSDPEACMEWLLGDDDDDTGDTGPRDTGGDTGPTGDTGDTAQVMMW